MSDESEGPLSPLSPPSPPAHPAAPGLVAPPPSSGVSLFMKICLGLGSLAMIGSCAALLSPTGRQFTQSSFELMTSVGGATGAPGTDALRAIGCDTAMVMPFESLLDPFGELSEALGQDEEQPTDQLDGTVLVQCIPTLWRDEALTCEEIAITYGEAVGTEDEFVVMLERAGVQACGGFYLADGTMTLSLDGLPNEFENAPDSFELSPYGDETIPEDAI